MKQLFIAAAAASFMLVAGMTAVPATVFAVEGSDTQPNTTVTSTASEGSMTSNKEDRQKRLETYKKTYKESLNTAAQKRLTDRCAAAQSIVKKYGTKTDSATAARTQKYQKLSQDLAALADKLEGQGADVTDLKTQLAELDTKIAAFQTAADTFAQSLTDVSAMDCTADVAAFKAALQAARAKQKEVHKASQAVRVYLQSTVKQTLQTIKSQLQPSTGSSETQQ